MNFELAETYALLGAPYFEDARKFYIAAIAAEDKTGRVPIAAIEDLANLESRLAESRGEMRNWRKRALALLKI